MAISHKSHGKKSDKETQSPVLKLFKDMMHKEKHDPEKTNLLKSKHAERKKKYFGSKTKSDNKTVRCASSDHHTYKRNQDLRNQDLRNQDIRNPEFEPSRTQSYPFQEGKRESWWFWNDNDVKRSEKDDTCSCVSCALKKIVGSDYACVACLGILFTVSVIVAFLLVYKSIPCLTSHHTDRDGERLKRKIQSDGLRWRWDHFGKRGGKFEDSGNSIPQSMDFTPNFQDLSGLVDSGSELSKILDGDKMSEIQSSDRLREFFKKLIKTDAQIRKLKKINEVNNENIDSVDSMDDKYKTYPDRAKRSLKIFNKPMKFFHFKNKHQKIVKENHKDNIVDSVKTKVTKFTTLTTMQAKPETRNKRFDNTSEPEGLIIEDKKVFIKYKPEYISKKVAKCSHVPKDSKSHEHELKHPFYQNTQRLDELLDKFLAKNLFEIMDPVGYDIFLDKKDKCKHAKVEDRSNKDAPGKTFLKDSLDLVDNNKKPVFKNVKDGKKASKSDTSTFGTDLFSDWEVIDGDMKTEGTTTNMDNSLMSVSTMMYDNNLNKRSNFPPNSEKASNVRKLLQIDVDEEQSIEHDDMKKMRYNDEINKEGDRKKIDAPIKSTSNQIEMKPVSVLNPNWKGPMPLYPEELNVMPKQRPVIVNKVETPVHTKDATPEIDEFEIDLSDTAYIEDYLHSNNERLVEMAQAYSDYGVLNSKKDPDKKMDDKRVKLSQHGLKTGLMNRLYGRSKKGFNELSEGIRIEILPTTSSSEDLPTEIFKGLKKHVKLTSFKDDPFLNPSQFTPSIDMNVFYEFKNDESTTTSTMPTAKPLAKEKGFVFAFGVGKRSLKAFEYDEESDERDDNYERDEDNPVVHIKGPFDISLFKFKRDIGNSTFGVNVIDNDAINTTDTANTLNDDKKTNQSRGMELSDFFMMLSNMFAALDGVDINLNHTQNSSVTNETIENTTTNTYLDQMADVKNATKEFNYPIYDSDMIENIGHRSRVLLSVNANLTDEAENEESKVESKETVAETAVTNFTMEHIQKSIDKNKTKIVKRNVDSNLIFWNDIYDEEYGVDSENLENNARDKHSIDRNYFMKKPNAWFRDKVRKITDGIHKKAKSSNKKEHKVVAVNTKQELHAKVETKKKSKPVFNKRISRNVAEDTPKKTDFVALTAKMKAICRKTAKDIEKNRKVDVREESSEGQVASSLMQQLVRLMSDLVDFQVEQKTCRKLPPDLQNFLEWLTASGPDTDSVKYNSEYKNDGFPEMDFSKQNDHTLDTSPSEREDKPESRSDCLGTLQTVQELMRQFDDMPDDDKSKMAGVREYLENQISYLQMQLSSTNDFSIYNTLRIKRDAAPEKNPKLIQKKKQSRLKQRLYNYLKNFKEKHYIKTNFDNQKIAHNNKENVKNNKISNVKNEKAMNKVANEIKKNNAEVKKVLKESKKDKKNIRDVYYKAIADAKKITTIKSHLYN